MGHDKPIILHYKQGSEYFSPPLQLSVSVLQLKMHSSQKLFTYSTEIQIHDGITCWKKVPIKNTFLNIENLVCLIFTKISDLLLAWRCKAWISRTFLV